MFPLLLALALGLGIWLYSRKGSAQPAPALPPAESPYEDRGGILYVKMQRSEEPELARMLHYVAVRATGDPSVWDLDRAGSGWPLGQGQGMLPDSQSAFARALEANNAGNAILILRHEASKPILRPSTPESAWMRAVAPQNIAAHAGAGGSYAVLIEQPGQLAQWEAQFQAKEPHQHQAPAVQPGGWTVPTPGQQLPGGWQVPTGWVGPTPAQPPPAQPPPAKLDMGLYRTAPDGVVWFKAPAAQAALLRNQRAIARSWDATQGLGTWELSYTSGDPAMGVAIQAGKYNSILLMRDPANGGSLPQMMKSVRAEGMLAGGASAQGQYAVLALPGGMPALVPDLAMQSSRRGR